MQVPEVLAIIPARGGSKRLPGKNLRLLAGKPLIAHSIEDGLKSKYVTKVIVSTDDPKTAEVAKEFGAEVPFLRPAELAGDKVSDVPVMAHAVQWLEENQGYYPEIIVTLRPTTPIRADDLVDRCIDRLLRSKGSAVRSVRNVGHWHPYWMLRVDSEGRATEFEPGKTVDVYYQSQLLPPVYKHDGYCDVYWRRNLPLNCPVDATLKGLYGNDLRVELNEEGTFINIDNLDEFELAEIILAKRRPLAGSNRNPASQIEKTS